MNRLLVRYAAWYVSLVTFGALCVASASVTPQGWLAVANLCIAAVDFCLAWRAYRRMVGVAMLLDRRMDCADELTRHQARAVRDTAVDLHNLIRLINGTDENKSEAEAQGEPPCQDESEDEYAHPV